MNTAYTSGRREISCTSFFVELKDASESGEFKAAKESRWEST
jgi:hypothetical protein